MPIAGPPADPAPLTDQEQADLDAMARFQREDAAYAQVQGTRPQTLGIALDDSPAGLLAWIVEKFRNWSDCDGDLARAFDRDRLITNVMLYWVTKTFTSSARLYWETMHSGVLREPLEPVTVPTGVARYPKEEVLRFPRSWVEQRYHVTHWAEMPRGGHFAAMEQPELFADDLRAFFRTVR
jgi:pimeloyl-ACP methyl ester carboxylesterase